MLILSKQVSLPKISLILQKMKICQKSDIRPFSTKAFNFTPWMRTISSITEKKLAEIYGYFFGKWNKCYRERHNGLGINNAGYLKTFFLGRRWISNQRNSKSDLYNTPHWKIIVLIRCARRSPKVTLITIFVSIIVVWKQAWWPPLFITFLISARPVTTAYQVSSEIYGGYFY